MKTICTALVAAGLLFGSSAAMAAEREHVSFKVSTAGVNFADPAAVAKFRKDVAREIERVCNPAERIEANLSPDFQCRREMTASLEPTVTRMTAAAMSRSRVATN